MDWTFWVVATSLQKSWLDLQGAKAKSNVLGMQMAIKAINYGSFNTHIKCMIVSIWATPWKLFRVVLSRLRDDSFIHAFLFENF